ncbi:DNA-directed RNA polymerase specialized sigma24 family protein [Actinomadura pelletieri DSM 43383]|uniref:DNA-directed RNA polymerase specialized sigma24 family protein n=1 Tax=Actinomadura pelletieri DSM 43383 TaxID=1120940 RepID=A0A495QU89_9ACTN|nr:RNA polymerase sigma factor [Actinomadura pelletieri]RKS77018.1 DNA-directed RNA polymerase specialized sigma24 family protein [Actinomadura pelletieri DSM 43383]
MPGDLETLYDAHAHRLYAHCWSLVGDQGAADALTSVFLEALRHPPRGETVLWLHHLARTVCSERGAFNHHGHLAFAQSATDPLLNAAGHLAPDHREALLLYAGEWLEIRDIARVLCVTPDDVRKLLHQARTALERLVLDALMRGTAEAAKHMDVITAFEKGRLPHLLARRAPALAPAPLRDRVLATADLDREPDPEPIPDEPVVPAAPDDLLVVIGPDSEFADRGRDRARRRRTALKGVGGMAGVAATITVGLMMTWPSAGEGSLNALGPFDGNGRTGSGPAGGSTRAAPAPTDGDAGDPSAVAPRGGTQQVLNPAPVVPQAPPAKTGDSPTARPPAPGTQPSRVPGGGGTPTRPERTPPPIPTDGTPTPTPSTPGPEETPTPEEPLEPPEDDTNPTSAPSEPVIDTIGSVTSPLFGGLAS